jgi:hypothetical protein
MSWQPIETAPKDGTPILTVCLYDNPPTYEINSWFEHKYDAYEPVGDDLYRKEEKTFSQGWSNNGHRADFWMPLPEPPSQEAPVSAQQAAGAPSSTVSSRSPECGIRRAPMRSAVPKMETSLSNDCWPENN